MARRHADEEQASPAPDVLVRVLREFTHYPDGVRKQDEAEGAEIRIAPDVADRWVAAGLVERV